MRESLAVDGEADGVVAGLEAGFDAWPIASLAWLGVLRGRASRVAGVDGRRCCGTAEASASAEAAGGTDVEGDAMCARLV